MANDFDVLVAGGGMAGMTAAATAVGDGARVIVVEKEGRLGGSAVLSAGILWAAPNRDALRRHVPLGDAALHGALVDDFPAALAFVRASGVEVGEATGGHFGYGVGHQIDIIGFIDRCRARVEAAGGAIVYRSAVRRLLTGDDGVTGAVLDGGDGTASLDAGAVVLATGGMQGDPELVATFIGGGADDMPVRAGRGSVGDGFRLGRAAGAATSRGLSAFYGHLVPADLDTLSEAHYLPLTQYHSNRCLLVNTTGRRFMDESLGDEHATQAVLRQPGSRAYLLADERMRREHVVTAPYPGGEVVDRFAESVRAGARLDRADTIAGLVDALADRGVPAGVLRATLGGYARAAAGDDDVVVDAPLPAVPTPLREAPFYALAVQPVITFTHGGLRTDAQARVLDRDGVPVAGLFAAGADAGGVHNVGYAGGLGSSLVFGRRAGRAAAAHASERKANA